MHGGALFKVAMTSAVTGGKHKSDWQHWNCVK